MSADETDVVDQIQERLDEIELDDRIHHPDAQVQTNAPLALVQTSLKARREELRWVLSLLQEDTDDD